jgi:hypothetical protein
MGSNVYITQVDVRHKKDPALDNQMPSNITPTNIAPTNATQTNSTPTSVTPTNQP